MERDGPLELDKASTPENGKETEKERRRKKENMLKVENRSRLIVGKKRKTYFTYWSGHDLENWELQSQPTITNDEMEELEELEQLIVVDKKELDKKNRICSNCCLQYSGEIWVYECLCVYECFCAYESLCAILQHEIANV